MIIPNTLCFLNIAMHRASGVNLMQTFPETLDVKFVSGRVYDC